MYEAWVGRAVVEYLAQLGVSAVQAIMTKVDAICASAELRLAESVSYGGTKGMRVAVEPATGRTFGWYYFDYVILYEQYLLIVNVAGPFQRIPD